MIKSLIRRRNFIVSIVLFILVFGLYLATSPRVETNHGDSNELIAASYTLGIPHPPGYPLFALLGKLFSFIPLGTIAFRYSIFSSFFGALTVVLVYLIITKIIIDSSSFIPAVVGALSLAFSHLFWLYSIIPEVFVLCNFFTALLIYLGISWYQSSVKSQVSEHKYLFLLALVAGLGFLSQQIIVLLAPAIFFLAFIIDKKIFFPSKKWLFVIAGLVLGLAPLIYLPLAAQGRVNPWGDPTNLRGFWRLISRAEYGGPQGGAYLPAEIGLEKSLAQLPPFFSSIINQFTFPFVLIMLWGIFLGIKKYRKATIFLILAFFFGGLFFVMYASVDWSKIDQYHQGTQERFYLTSSVILSIFLGMGIAGVRTKKIITYCLLFLPVILLVANYSSVDKSNYRLGEDFTYNLLLNIEPDAIVLAKGDVTIFGPYYLQKVKRERLDVKIIELGIGSWVTEKLREEKPALFTTKSSQPSEVIRDIIRTNITSRPLYIIGPGEEEVSQLGLAGNPFFLVPQGLVYKISPRFELPAGDPWEKMRYRGSYRKDDYRDHFTKYLIDLYSSFHYNGSLFYHQQGYYDLARQELKAALAVDPNNSLAQEATKKLEESGKKDREPVRYSSGTAKEHRNTADFLIEAKKYQEAIAELYWALDLDPNNLYLNYKLGTVFETIGWYEDAFWQYEKALEKFPEQKEVQEHYDLVKFKLGK